MLLCRHCRSLLVNQVKWSQHAMQCIQAFQTHCLSQDVPLCLQAEVLVSAGYQAEERAHFAAESLQEQDLAVCKG